MPGTAEPWLSDASSVQAKSAAVAGACPALQSNVTVANGPDGTLCERLMRPTAIWSSSVFALVSVSP